MYNYELYDELTIIIECDYISGDSKELGLNKDGKGKLVLPYQYIEYYFIEK